MATKSTKEPTKRELELRPVKNVPMSKRDAAQKLERKILHQLYSARKATDPAEVKSHKAQAAKLEAELRKVARVVDVG